MSDAPKDCDRIDLAAAAISAIEVLVTDESAKVDVQVVKAELERLRAMEQRARELGAGRANGPYGQGVNDACSSILGET